MRVMVLGGTRFVGAAITEELHAHGHELLLVHRGEHELDGATGAMVDTSAMSAADAEPSVGDFAADDRALAAAG